MSFNKNDICVKNPDVFVLLGLIFQDFLYSHTKIGKLIGITCSNKKLLAFITAMALKVLCSSQCNKFWLNKKCKKTWQFNSEKADKNGGQEIGVGQE